MKWARPERVQARLRQAATLKETLYGLLAASALGIEAPEFAGLHNYHDAEWRKIAREPNVQAANGLVEIGEAALAERFIKHQAKLGEIGRAWGRERVGQDGKIRGGRGY